VGVEYYIISVAQSQVLNAHSGLKITVQPSTGSVAQFQAVRTKEAHTGMSTAQGMSDAWRGEKTFSNDGRQTWLRAIQCGSPTLFGLVTRQDTGITSISGLRGKRVTFNYSADLTARFTARQQMIAFGLDPDKDVIAQAGEFTQAGYTDLKEGRTDAAIGALRNSFLLEVATVSPLVVLPFPANLISYVHQELPGMFPIITDGVPAVADGIPVVGSPCVMYTYDDFPEDVVYIMLKTLLERQDELIAQNEGLMKYWSKENAIRDFGVPYHPGAIKYYKEIGLWTNEIQAMNDAALNSIGK
jgi:TRAP transporter TAXI family solute receptor